jgi:hypothetical protein
VVALGDQFIHPVKKLPTSSRIGVRDDVGRCAASGAFGRKRTVR